MQSNSIPSLYQSTFARPSPRLILIIATPPLNTLERPSCALAFDQPYMTTVHSGKPWDFSQVLELINTLDAKQNVPQAIPARPSYNDFALPGSHSLPNDSPFNIINHSDQGGVGLGNFAKVWEFLGAPSDALPPQIPPETTKLLQTSPTLQDRMPNKTDYTSDGAVYLTPGKKNIQWRDEANGGDLTDVAPGADLQNEKLTKTQRKKKNRQERKRLAAEAHISASDFESEAEEQRQRLTPARKASAHNVVTDSPALRYNLRPRDVTGHAVTATENTITTTPIKKSPESFFEKRERSRSPTKQQRSKSSITETNPSTPKPKAPIFGDRKNSQPISTQSSTPATDGKTKDKKEWPVTSNLWGNMSRFLPASVKPTRNAEPMQTAIKTDGKIEPVQDSPSKSGNRNLIKPKIVRTGDDRDLALLLKLISAFYEDKSHLVRPTNPANHSNNPKGIHVFVDASNIFIGFHDQLKRSRDIPQHHHVPRVDMSFGALALLMERRRPIAKRVLVGSKPNLSAFDTAREIGYECNILDKVLKARELTDRQKYFQEQERKQRAKANRYRSGSDSGGNASETNSGPVYAPEAFVEQGVDEILHLKMMESLVDTEEPGIMVLATGDAAQAEYSQGFMKMTQRALQKGWKLELVSWSKNISQAYKKSAFRKEWGDRFKIIELDDYAEELLDM